MPRIPNTHYTDRLALVVEHASLTASLGKKFYQALQPTRVKSVKYINPTGLATHADNWFTVDVRRNGAADALVVADDTFTAANATEILTAVGHGLQTGDGPIRISNSGGALPTGLAAATDYYIIRIDADTFYLAASRALAYAGTNLTFTSDGTGTHTLSDTASTRRPVAIATGIDTDTTGAALAADTFVSLTLSSGTDEDELILAAGDELILCCTEGGTATLPAGSLLVELDII
jgi:hypothetical protein